MSTLDVQRATAIISRGQEHGYFPEGKMPESETDRIVEAEKLVVLAQQVEVLAKEIGKHNIPGWPAAEAILFEANVTMGSGENNGHGAPAEDPNSYDEHAPLNTQQLSGTPPLGREERETNQSAENVHLPTTSSESATTREDPQKEEVWADAQGEEWEVLSYGGGPSAEVMKVSTGEKTLVPAGMLKTKVRDAPGAQQESMKDVMVRAITEQDQEDARQRAAASNESDHEPTEKSATQRFREAVTKVAAALPTPETPDTSIPEHDDEDDERYQSILAETEERYTPAGWVIPHELQEPPDLMPEMLDQVPDVMAQRLHSQFNAAAARAKYLHDVEDARARGCKLTRKLFLRGAMRKAREELGSSSTITEREAWAEDFDDDVKVWGERANKHEENARAWKTFFDLYTQNVVVLSRDWTMRDQQEKS